MTRVCRLSPLPEIIRADVQAIHDRVQKQKEREMADYVPSEAYYLECCKAEGILRPFTSAAEMEYHRDEDDEMACGPLEMSL